MASPTLREELLDLLSVGVPSRVEPCHGYACGCICPACQKRARKGARARVRSDETRIMAKAMELGMPVDRAAARSILSRYRTADASIQVLEGMRQAKLRQAA